MVLQSSGKRPEEAGCGRNVGISAPNLPRIPPFFGVWDCHGRRGAQIRHLLGLLDTARRGTRELRTGRRPKPNTVTEGKKRNAIRRASFCERLLLYTRVFWLGSHAAELQQRS